LSSSNVFFGGQSGMVRSNKLFSLTRSGVLLT
jgi:hypothetical protein